MSKISINLVTWNGEKYIKHCINSVLNQTIQDFELNVLDNGSHDKTIEVIEKNFPEIKIVKNKENIGFAKAHNKLITWAKSNYIMCLNQDMILELDFLENIFDFLENVEDKYEIGSIEPKLLQWKFNYEDPYNADKNGKTNIIDTCGLMVFKNHKVIDFGQLHENSAEFNETKEIFGPSGACPIYFKEALENIKVNGEYFDEDFFSYKEDVDLAFRLRLAGYKSYFVHNAICYHDRSVRGGISVVENRKSKPSWINEYSYRNHFYVLLKNEFTLNFIRCFFQLLIYELKKFFYILLYERNTLIFCFKNTPKFKKMIQKRKYIFKSIVKIKSRDLYKWYK